METYLVKADWEVVREFVRLSIPKDAQFCFIKLKEPDSSYFRSPNNLLVEHLQKNGMGIECKFDFNQIHPSLYTWGQREYFL